MSSWMGRERVCGVKNFELKRVEEDLYWLRVVYSSGYSEWVDGFEYATENHAFWAAERIAEFQGVRLIWEPQADSMLGGRDPWEVMNHARKHILAFHGLTRDLQERLAHLMAYDLIYGCCIELAKERK